MQNQKWEYAYIVWPLSHDEDRRYIECPLGKVDQAQYLVGSRCSQSPYLPDFDPFPTDSKLIHLHPTGQKVQHVKAKSLGPLDWRGQFYVWVTQLGQEGYEMTGVMNIPWGPSDTMQQFWFKRPFE
jgi:hypothetical protein